MTSPTSPEALLGVAVVPLVFDPETRRSSCSRCRRIVATGQTGCVCGAIFGAAPIEMMEPGR